MFPRGIMTQTFLALTVETGDENATLYCLLALLAQRIIQNEESFGKIHALLMFISHINMLIIFETGRFTNYITLKPFK